MHHASTVLVVVIGGVGVAVITAVLALIRVLSWLEVDEDDAIPED